ncbi:unnamed protein product [Protopolystoma xenopodis]|uniref:Uncharacterized protein n=1 Tax=Protopolystoma xenopodis TaxID=117903 RepID=A0A3S5CUE7_9PLAT|nr:unnamed protein product [Protopolystoma xenopodis]
MTEEGSAQIDLGSQDVKPRPFSRNPNITSPKQPSIYESLPLTLSAEMKGMPVFCNLDRQDKFNVFKSPIDSILLMEEAKMSVSLFSKYTPNAATASGAVMSSRPSDRMIPVVWIVKRGSVRVELWDAVRKELLLCYDIEQKSLVLALVTA